MSGRLHGIVAGFDSPEAFLAGLRRVREAGYAAVEVNVPFAVAGMDEWLPGPASPLARVMLLAGLAGAAAGYSLQEFAAHNYPLDVGGRPLDSWPAFVPVTFEFAVLTAALVGVAAWFWLCGLPRLDHPLFSVPEFARASQDRYFVGVRSSDPRFDAAAVAELLAAAGPEFVREVRP